MGSDSSWTSRRTGTSDRLQVGGPAELRGNPRLETLPPQSARPETPMSDPVPETSQGGRFAGIAVVPVPF